MYKAVIDTAKEKMNKKAQKRMAAERRSTWAFSPITKKIDSTVSCRRSCCYGLFLP